MVASGERHPAIEGYDPEGLYERYRACREAVSGELGGDWRSDRRAILREMERRDLEWLRTGKAPEVGYDSPETKAWKVATKRSRRDHEEELETAKRLSGQGVRCVFVADEKLVEEDGRKRKVGLPDLAGGQEIKTLSGASTYSTIDGYIRNASGKQGARIRVIGQNVLVTELAKA